MNLTRFACGCCEDTNDQPSLVCPAHGAPARSRVAIGSKAFTLAFGRPLPDLPPGGLFYPNIQGAKP